MALGTSPLMSTSIIFLFHGLGVGDEAVRAIVYGCRGLGKTRLVGPYSTILPEYITATMSDM